jgi:hypothetical protein
MSEFTVTTAAVAEVSDRVGGISGRVGDMHGRIANHSSAADDTPLGGAFGGLMSRWAAVLPLYAVSGERLSNAVAAAALHYRESDAAVAAAAAARPERGGEHSK